MRPALSRRFAKAQLSLVEHALCPLDAQASLRPQFVHETQYFYSDPHRNRRAAHVRVGAVDGLSAHDELYLWGLLALAISQPEPSPDFRATPYYCLRQLGLLSADKKGGREFELFRAAIKRLAGVRYQNDHFYDPVRGEARAVSFGLLSFSLPLDPASSRAWRIAWDPIFFEFVQATGGALAFDMALYRQLDPAARRLYLWLKKLFWRRDESPLMDLRHLAVDILGFSSALEMRFLKRGVKRCLNALLGRGLLRLPVGATSASDLFTKEGPGRYRLRLLRGPNFDDHAATAQLDPADSSLADALRSIGLEEPMVKYVLSSYPRRVVQEWADITLAALERRGRNFFSVSPQAYFVDNVKAAAAGNRTPPDWWRELRKQELAQEREQQRARDGLLDEAGEERAFNAYLQSEARGAFAELLHQIESNLRAAGTAESDARQRADMIARMNLRSKFRREHPDQVARVPTPLDREVSYDE